MTRQETVQVLALLKAAYPASYKGMTRQEANGVISVWATQFAQTPVDVILIAVNKLIATSPFPPAVSEVKGKLKDMYWEATFALKLANTYGNLTDGQRRRIARILDVCGREPEPASAARAGGEETRSLPAGGTEDEETTNG